jgi:hypothetical protein
MGSFLNFVILPLPTQCVKKKLKPSGWWRNQTLEEFLSEGTPLPVGKLAGKKLIC